MGVSIGHYEWSNTGHNAEVLAAVMGKAGMTQVTVTADDVEGIPPHSLSITGGDDAITFTLEPVPVLSTSPLGDPVKGEARRGVEVVKPGRAAMFGAGVIMLVILAAVVALLGPLVIRLWEWGLGQ